VSNDVYLSVLVAQETNLIRRVFS